MNVLLPPTWVPTERVDTEAAFWAMTDSCFSAASHFADERLQLLEHLDLPELRTALGPYRFFTGQYTADLAVLIAKLPPGPLRSSLGEFLDEELGHGDPDDSHPRMYDGFLVSLGCDPETLDDFATAVTTDILGGAAARLWAEPVAYGIGLRAMGAECLCQVFLTAADHYLRRNPVIRAMYDDIDWQFLDIHAGPADAAHRDETKARIEEMIADDPGAIVDLARGYRDGEAQWHRYWDSCLPRR